jgi:hypothetical protein
MENYSSFYKSDHLQPSFSKRKFQDLHDWDFGWEILEPINIATDNEDSEIELSKRLSPGQKALYFFWYLDAQVTNGGFIQFYWNGYRKYLAPILQGLQLVGDQEMLQLVKKADDEYLVHQTRFGKQQELNDWEPLYEELTKFDGYDSTYYEIHDRTMALIEKYARSYPAEFVKLVD